MDIILYGLCHYNLKPFYALCMYLGYFGVTCDSEPDVYSVLACDSCEVFLCDKFYF